MSKRTISTKGGATAADGDRTRRAALHDLVGASALALPAIGSAAPAFGDPIFTAIDGHKAAWQALEATRFAMDDVTNTHEREVSEAEWNAYDGAHKTEDATFDEFLTSAPQAVAGCER